MNEDSIFTKIINHEIPGEIIYEDDQCAVLLTIEPINPGHSLVVPKKQVDSLWDTDDELYQHLLALTKIIAKKIEKVYDYQRIGMLVEGFGVPHAHIHVFGYKEPLEPTITYHTAHKHTATADELAQEAAKLRV